SRGRSPAQGAAENNLSKSMNPGLEKRNPPARPGLPDLSPLPPPRNMANDMYVYQMGKMC
ncbi:MAG TPA: hypothetical protein PK794_05295, partial [Armatimonadota bacterium]|nr:hypothetical protein [Armatimonadota bacterium]